jgi:single-stranded DNA-binding protein
MKPDKPGRNRSCSTIFPFGLKAEFLAQQNRRPPPSFADASARSCLAGAGTGRPTSFEPHPRDRRHEPKARGDGKRNEAMNTIAEFTIIGRVGEIRQVGTTLRVNIASSYSRKDNRGEWVERTRWNEVTVFGESSLGYVRRNIVKGDLVFTRARWAKRNGRRTEKRSTASRLPPNASSACARARTTARTRTMSRRKGALGRPTTPTFRSDCSPRTGEASASPPFSLPYRTRRQSMAYQIYRIGEWERVGGVEGYCAIRAYFQPVSTIRSQEGRLPRRPGLRERRRRKLSGCFGRRKPVRQQPTVARRLVAHSSARPRFRRLPLLRRRP